MIDGVELEGLEWTRIYDTDGFVIGYRWEPDMAWTYDSKGNKTLRPNYFQQTIFFSDNDTFDPESDFNMGSSTATVFKSDGTTETFRACTMPSDLESYPTIPKGSYEATVGIHTGSTSSYTALRMHDSGAIESKIELGFENPAYSDGRTFAQGVNIHKPGKDNKTGMTLSNIPISAGCFLTDLDRWNEFIGLFNNTNQKDNPVDITVSRTAAIPCIERRDWFILPKNLFEKQLIQKDATNTYNTQ